MSHNHGKHAGQDTDLTRPGRSPDHDDAQPGQTGAAGRDIPRSPDTTDVPDDEASPGTPE